MENGFKNHFEYQHVAEDPVDLHIIGHPLDSNGFLVQGFKEQIKHLKEVILDTQQENKVYSNDEIQQKIADVGELEKIVPVDSVLTNPQHPFRSRSSRVVVMPASMRMQTMKKAKLPKR